MRMQTLANGISDKVIGGKWERNETTNFDRARIITCFASAQNKTKQHVH